MHSRNYRHYYLKAKRQIRDFLLSEKNREFLVYLLFVLIAAAFWLMQTLDKEYETDITVPVRLRGVPENIVVTSEPVGEISVHVQDKGMTLLNYMLTKHFYPITLNYGDYLAQDNRVALPSSSLLRNVSSQLSSTTRVLSISPDTVDYYYSEGVSRRVPVRFDGKVAGDRQYYVSDTLFIPDSVDVYAVPSALDTIVAAYTETADYGLIEDTLRTRVQLATTRGMKFVPGEVELVVPVDIYTEKTIEVPVKGINFPANKTLRAFPSKVQVTFQIGMSRYREVDENDFHILVSYEELLNLDGDKYNVKIRNLPPSVRQVRCNPSQVDFIIEQYSQHEAD